VALGNDAHITTLGEHVYGTAHGMQNFIVVSFGHGGIGSCMYSNGMPHLGSNGSAGEIGHTCIVDGGRLCSCGRHGCLEAYASDRGIIQTARELMDESDQPSLMRSLEELTVKAIALCCDQGDELALEVFHRTGEVLGIALANVASILDPEAVILADQPADVFKWLLEPTKEVFNRNVFGNIRDKVRLVISDLNNNERDVLGAAALAWTVKEYSLFK
jgi:glucokinase